MKPWGELCRGSLANLTRVLDKGKQEKLLLCWLVALVRLRGEGRGERGEGMGEREKRHPVGSPCSGCLDLAVG